MKHTWSNSSHVAHGRRSKQEHLGVKINEIYTCWNRKRNGFRAHDAVAFHVVREVRCMGFGDAR